VIKYVELCREVEKKQKETQKKKQVSTTKEQKMNSKIQNLQKIAQLQEQKMAISMQGKTGCLYSHKTFRKKQVNQLNCPPPWPTSFQEFQCSARVLAVLTGVFICSIQMWS
jgi:hypothetical protein